jgi:hypothetical protein
MLKALIGFWSALCASFAVCAAIVGMPALSIAFEIVRASVVVVAIGAATAAGLRWWHSNAPAIADRSRRQAVSLGPMD